MSQPWVKHIRALSNQLNNTQSVDIPDVVLDTSDFIEPVITAPVKTIEDVKSESVFYFSNDAVIAKIVATKSTKKPRKSKKSKVENEDDTTSA